MRMVPTQVNSDHAVSCCTTVSFTRLKPTAWMLVQARSHPTRLLLVYACAALMSTVLCVELDCKLLSQMADMTTKADPNAAFTPLDENTAAFEQDGAHCASFQCIEVSNNHPNHQKADSYAANLAQVVLNRASKLASLVAQSSSSPLVRALCHICYVPSVIHAFLYDAANSHWSAGWRPSILLQTAARPAITSRLPLLPVRVAAFQGHARKRGKHAGWSHC